MDLPTPEIAVGRAADLVLIDLDAEWEVGEAGLREPLARTAASPAAASRARSHTTIAAGGIVYRERVLAAV